MKPLRLRIAPHWLTLAAAILLGLASFAAARTWLSTQARAAEARVTADLQPHRLLVAATDLEPGTVLLPELLAARSVPGRFAGSAAVRAEQIDRVEGQLLVHPVKSGEPILWPALSRGDEAAFSAQLEPGRRAITFAVDEINAFAGLLVPGDVIDLLYTSDEHGRPTVRTLLQQVTVLATGTMTREHSGRTPEPGAARSFATVTIGVTPDEATRIVLAQRAGELTALLRHPADAARLDERTVDSRVLAGATEARPRRVARATPRPDYVEFIVGGAARTREALPPDPSPTAARPPAALDPGDIHTRLAPLLQRKTS